jgi:nucleoside-diphosphate-sugar epimerase
MKNILLIGGTGIIGSAMVKEATRRGFDVTVITQEKSKHLPKKVKQLVLNRHNRNKFREAVTQLHTQWDIVFDIYAYDEKDAKQTYDCFKASAKHIFVLSTTLVYDRSKPNKGAIKPSSRLAKMGIMGGYVDHKLKLEQFWRQVTDVNWTILRPYHIIGSGSLLGCVPLHNRDPKLLQRMRNGNALTICNGGTLELNFIHPKDIAKIILKAYGNKKTFSKAYNTVNPAVITAHRYFKMIGDILKTKAIIKNKPIAEIWCEKAGWELTTLPHLYDVTDLQKDIGFTPNIPLRAAIKDAIAHYPIFHGSISRVPIHQNMNRPPRPKSIPWLLK